MSYFEDRQQGQTQSGTYNSGSGPVTYNGIVFNFTPPPAGYVKTGTLVMLDSPPNMSWLVCKSNNQQALSSFSALPIGRIYGAGSLENVQAQPNEVITVVAVTTGTGFIGSQPPLGYNWTSELRIPINVSSVSPLNAVWVGSLDQAEAVASVGPSNTGNDNIPRWNRQSTLVVPIGGGGDSENNLVTPIEPIEVSEPTPFPTADYESFAEVSGMTYSSVSVGASGSATLLAVPAAGFYYRIYSMGIFSAAAAIAGAAQIIVNPGGQIIGGQDCAAGGFINFLNPAKWPLADDPNTSAPLGLLYNSTLGATSVDFYVIASLQRYPATL